MINRIIAIEGIDGSGKKTQTKRLVKSLSAAHIPVTEFSFPIYESTGFGKEITRYLNGEYGEMADLPPKFAALLYANNRLEVKDELLSKYDAGQTIVFDRYVSSNVAFQSARFHGAQRQAMATWIEELEYGLYGLPKAHITFFLDVPAEISKELILKKSTRNYTKKTMDMHESNHDYLMETHAYYRELAKTRNWTTIQCYRNDVLRTEDDIAKEILEITKETLSLKNTFESSVTQKAVGFKK